MFPMPVGIFNLLAVIDWWVSACPMASGAAAAIVCTEEFVIANGLQHKAVEIVSQAMVTDMASSFDKRYCFCLVSV